MTSSSPVVCPRSRSVRIKNQAGIVRHGRSNSVVSKSGRRIYKNLGRMHSVDYHDVGCELELATNLRRSFTNHGELS